LGRRDGREESWMNIGDQKIDEEEMGKERGKEGIDEEWKNRTEDE